jgi:hypothetical protein
MTQQPDQPGDRLPPDTDAPEVEVPGDPHEVPAGEDVEPDAGGIEPPD